MVKRTDYSKTAHLQQRRAFIKETARKMILDKGIAQTNMKDIAIACTIGRKTLYRFFPNIEILAEEILLDLAQSKQSFRNCYVIRGDTAEEKLYNWAHDYLCHCMENRELLQYYYEYDYYFRAMREKKVPTFWKNKRNELLEIIEEGIKDGSFDIPEDQAAKVSITIALSIIGLIQRVILRNDAYEYEYDYLVKDTLLLAGLLTRGVVKKRTNTGEIPESHATLSE